MGMSIPELGIRRLANSCVSNSCNVCSCVSFGSMCRWRARFESHLHLLSALYAVYNPMPYEAARDMEVEIEVAIGLWEAGYGVWQV